MYSKFKNLSNLITGVSQTLSLGEAPDQDSSASTVTINGQQAQACPGIRLEDKAGLRCARKSGWIISYDTLLPLVDNNYFWDIKTEDALEPIFSHFSTAILRLQAERNKNAKIKVTTEERNLIVGQIFDQLLGSSNINRRDVETTGYIVLRFKLELRTTRDKTVNDTIAAYLKRGAIPPVIVTPQAMEYLSRNHNLVEIDDPNKSLIFAPNLQPIMQSTRNDQEDYSMDINEQISEITFNQDSIRGAINTYLDKTVVDLGGQDELQEIVTDMNETVSKQRELIISVSERHNKTDTLKIALEQKYREQHNDIEALKQEISDQQRVLSQKTNEIEDKDLKISELKIEYEAKIDALESDVQEYQEREHSSGLKVPMEDLTKVEDELADREVQIKEHRSEKQKLKTQIKHLKKEMNSKVEELQAESCSLTERKDVLEQQVRNNEKSLRAKEEEYANLKAENVKLELERTELEEKVNKLNLSMAELSKRSDTAVRATRDMATSPRYKKLSRKLSLRDSDDELEISHVGDLLKPSKVDNPIVATLSTKEASNLVPRWGTDDNIVAYCQKITNAWNLCQSENFNEEKFCQILRLYLPPAPAQVYDNMADADKKVVTKITEALLSRLDRQENEYLQEFSTVRKGPLETHNAYALRVQRLYALGTGASSTMTERDHKLIVEAFLNGLPTSESTALRLVASDDEMQSVDKLAKRASRTARTQKPVNAVPIAAPIPERQEFNGPKFKGKCYFCKKDGHVWRRCYHRARTNQSWRPTYMKKQAKKQE